MSHLFQPWVLKPEALVAWCGGWDEWSLCMGQLLTAQPDVAMQDGGVSLSNYRPGEGNGDV